MTNEETYIAAYYKKHGKLPEGDVVYGDLEKTIKQWIEDEEGAQKNMDENKNHNSLKYSWGKVDGFTMVLRQIERIRGSDG